MEENKNDKNDKINRIFRAAFIIFGVLLLFCLLETLGLFNFLYFHRLKSIADKDLDIFNNYINNKIKITRTISDDTIIQSSLIQHDYKTQLIDAFKHLVLYKQNYPAIRNITLFNPSYEIVLASEMDDHIINKNLNKEWFINSTTKGFYISDINYVSKYNEYLLSIIYSIKNIIDDNIGYLMVDFSLSPLFDSFKDFKNTVVILKKQNRFIFTYPLIDIVKKETDLSRFHGIIEKDYDPEHKFIVAAKDDFFSIPGYIKIILILLFFLLVLFFLIFGFEKYSKTIESRKERLRKMTSDIISFSKDADKNVEEKKKGAKDERIIKDVEKNVDKFIRKRRASENIEKTRPGINKLKKQNKSDFIFIE